MGQASYTMKVLTQSFSPLVGAWCLYLARPTVAQLEVSLALTICESGASFFVSSWCVNLIRLFLCDDALH